MLSRISFIGVRQSSRLPDRNAGTGPITYFLMRVQVLATVAHVLSGSGAMTTIAAAERWLAYPRAKANARAANAWRASGRRHTEHAPAHPSTIVHQSGGRYFFFAFIPPIAVPVRCLPNAASVKTRKPSSGR